MSMTMSSQTAYEENNDDLLCLLTDAWENPLKETIKDARWIHDYLTRLTSLSLDQLLHEPLELRQEQANAIKDAQQLACHEYPLLFHAQTCRDTVEETMDELDGQLEQFIQSVPELEEACRVFEAHANTIKQERNKIVRVLEHQQVLTDVLEIPQLMETCVRNSYYSEAMDLASHVRLLSVRYPLPIIHSIQQQVQASSDRMLIQLISHLRKPVRLAAAMNMVGFLRRMDAFDSEAELRMVFLRCRHDYLQQRLLRIKRDLSDDTRQRGVDVFEYTKKFIDIMREQMFETGTQYVSIFPHEQGTLLSDYMVHVTQLIKSTLTTYLPMIEDTSSLASLLNQLQYCGMSLGRIGLDFRNIIVHLFEEALQPMLIRWINNAAEELKTTISKATLEGSLPSTWMASKTTSTTQTKRSAFQPPMLLVGYPSLAVFTNNILSVLNSLRLLPAISLCQPIISTLDSCFLFISVALQQYGDYVQKHMPDELVFLQSYAAAYAQCCVPYLESCLVDGIYGHLSMPKKHEDAVNLVLQAYLPVRVKEPIPSELDKELLSKDQQMLDSKSSSLEEVNEIKTSPENLNETNTNTNTSSDETDWEHMQATDEIVIANDMKGKASQEERSEVNEVKTDDLVTEETTASPEEKEQYPTQESTEEENNDGNEILEEKTRDDGNVLEEKINEAKDEVNEKEDEREIKADEQDFQQMTEPIEEKVKEEESKKIDEADNTKKNDEADNTKKNDEADNTKKNDEADNTKEIEEAPSTDNKQNQQNAKQTESKPKTNQKKKHKNKKGKR